MAIYHLAAKVIKRSAGRSATAAAAYRSGSRIQDFRTGAIHDYTRRRGVYGSEIHAPPGAPAWVIDRSALWNAVEFGERRRDAQVSREMNLALPRELAHPAQMQLLRQFVHEVFVTAGMIADVAFHDLDSPNPHAHVMLTMRTVTAEGFGGKNRAWDAVERLREWRERWSIAVNAALALAGRADRVDHRSLAEQGGAKLPAVHMGPKWTALNRERPATPTEQRDQRSQANAAVAALNGAREMRWAVDPAKAARSAAAHYDRLSAAWRRAHRQPQLERWALHPVPTAVDWLERRAEYVRRRTAIERAEHNARDAAVNAIDLALLAPVVRDPRVTERVQQATSVADRAQTTVDGLREDMRRWADSQRIRVSTVITRMRERQRKAAETLRALGALVAQAEHWRAQIHDEIPAHLDRRRPRLR